MYFNKITELKKPKNNNEMKKETYNGWTNYATWRVMLEIFDGQDFEDNDPEDITPEFCEDFVDILFYDTPEGFVEDYARAFLSDVNYYEISKHIKDNINEINEYKNR